MENSALVLLVVCGTILFCIQRIRYKKQLDELAAESSKRIQEYHSKLVKVCTEPQSLEAKEIIHQTCFFVEEEKMLWMGETPPDDIRYNAKGIWAHIKEQKGGLN